MSAKVAVTHSALAGRVRKGDLPAFHQQDVTAAIGRAMGGQAFFLEIEARKLHRIGLHSGLAWLLPYGAAKDGIDFIRVVVERGGRTLAMEFGKAGRAGEGEAQPFEPIRRITGLALKGLRAAYEENT